MHSCCLESILSLPPFLPPPSLSHSTLCGFAYSIKEVILYVAFCFWLFSLNMLFLGFILVVAEVSASFLFIA